MQSLKRLVRRALTGSHAQQGERYGPDMEPEFVAIGERAKPFTMTSPERQYALFKAVEYVASNGIPGDIVECGVWRGGSSMIVALALERFGAADRTLYLYDTFAGMSEPSAADVSLHGEASIPRWRASQQDEFNAWDYAPLEDVERNMASTGYPREKIVYVRGDVAKTIPATLPRQIALLRLDTDWYESTRHELEHLFPLLVPGGVLIVDDYGHWAGARKAVDEYFRAHGTQMLLSRIDYTGRIGVKTA